MDAPLHCTDCDETVDASLALEDRCDCGDGAGDHRGSCRLCPCPDFAWDGTLTCPRCLGPLDDVEAVADPVSTHRAA